MQETKETNEPETIEVKQLKAKSKECYVGEDGSTDASFLTGEAERASTAPTPEFKVETHDLGHGQY